MYEQDFLLGLVKESAEDTAFEEALSLVSADDLEKIALAGPIPGAVAKAVPGMFSAKGAVGQGVGRVMHHLGAGHATPVLTAAGAVKGAFEDPGIDPMTGQPKSRIGNMAAQAAGGFIAGKGLQMGGGALRGLSGPTGSYLRAAQANVAKGVTNAADRAASLASIRQGSKSAVARQRAAKGAVAPANTQAPAPSAPQPSSGVPQAQSDAGKTLGTVPTNYEAALNKGRSGGTIQMKPSTTVSTGGDNGAVMLRSGQQGRARYTPEEMKLLAKSHAIPVNAQQGSSGVAPLPGSPRSFVADAQSRQWGHPAGASPVQAPADWSQAVSQSNPWPIAPLPGSAPGKIKRQSVDFALLTQYMSKTANKANVLADAAKYVGGHLKSVADYAHKAGPAGVGLAGAGFGAAKNLVAPGIDPRTGQERGRIGAAIEGAGKWGATGLLGGHAIKHFNPAIQAGKGYGDIAKGLYARGAEAIKGPWAL